MDQQDQSPPSLFEMEVDTGAQTHLLAISKWSRFISIVIFCCIALVLLGLLINAEEIMQSASILSSVGDSDAAVFVIVIMVVALVFFSLWFFFLFKSSRHIKRGIYTRNSAELAEGFKALRISAVFSVIYSALTILTKFTSLG
jgi:membrane protein DedA with SNARE-associated domain